MAYQKVTIDGGALGVKGVDQFLVFAMQHSAQLSGALASAYWADAVKSGVPNRIFLQQAKDHVAWIAAIIEKIETDVDSR